MTELHYTAKTSDGRPILCGEDVFKLKDEMGFPFSMTFSQCEARGWEIAWIELMEHALGHGWDYFKTMEAIVEGFQDSGAWADKRAEIERRLKAYIVSKLTT